MTTNELRHYPYARPCLDEFDVAAVFEVLQSSMLTTGPRVVEFEGEMAARLGPVAAAAVSSGTAALHLTALALGLGPGDEVIVPTLTFLATANAVRYVGAQPILVDVDPVTLSVAPSEVARLIATRPRVRAVFVVHFAGLPAPLPALRAVTQRANIALVEDAAHALGAEYEVDGTRHEVGDGAHVDATCFSFHAVKHIATGEGGMVVARDEKFVSHVRRLRHHGLESPPEGRDRDGPWYREMRELGYNYRLTDIQCALGRSQLQRLSQFVERRRAIARRYDDAFREFPELDVRASPAGAHSSYHLYTLELSADFVARRRAVFEYLQANRVGVTVNYLPLHRNPYYSAQAEPGKFAVAEAFYHRSICLPMYPDLTDDDVDEIIGRVRRALDSVR
ncbi:MAG: aminotransferase class I/II-fold pyridoxal phosphate-dependent enzyme [Planctomycetota bacterium]